MKYWPLLVGTIILIGALYTGKRDILANAEDIMNNDLSISQLENRVITEGTATALALQALRLKQEAAIKAQKVAAERQDEKLDAILWKLKIKN